MPRKGQILTDEEKARIWPTERRIKFSIVCREAKPKGDKSPYWINGKSMNNGRVMIHNPLHPRACKTYKYVFEHVLIAEKAIGKFLPSTAKVHHIDGEKTEWEVLGNIYENPELLK